MANELNTAQPATGLTITAQLFKSGITVGSAITCAEIGTTRFYTGNMPAITAGTYQIAFYNSTTPIASGSIAWNGSDEILVNDLSTATTAGTAIAVRSELGVELGRIDVATSSRLASASYTTPPTAAANASATRTELAPELTEITEVHAIHGLDIANALTVTPTQRSAGAITQAITGDGTTNTVVTRI